MKIDFSAAIKDLDGNPAKHGEKDATLGHVACTALLASYADEQNLAAEDKVKRFRLAETLDGQTITTFHYSVACEGIAST
jgi:hypothetical protein